MAKRIFLQETDMTLDGITPIGYKEIGYNGMQFSEKSGATVSSIGGFPYKVYSGIGGIPTFTYTGFGVYTMTLGGIFLDNKTICLGQLNYDYANLEWITFIGVDGSGNIRITNFDNTNAAVNGIGRYCIEIRVYP